MSLTIQCKLIFVARRGESEKKATKTKACEQEKKSRKFAAGCCQESERVWKKGKN